MGKSVRNRDWGRRFGDSPWDRDTVTSDQIPLVRKDPSARSSSQQTGLQEYTSLSPKALNINSLSAKASGGELSFISLWKMFS